MNLFSIFAELSLDSAKYEKGIKDAKNQAVKFEKEQEKLEDAVEGTTKDLNAQKTSTNKLESAMSSASKVAGGFGKAISGMSKAITGVVGGATALIGALAGVSAGTIESREDMNKLNASFKANGKTIKEAEKVYKGFYGILGESDTAVEASNLLIQLTDDNKELAKWADISAGVMATFPDSLPIESLIEASNETAKVGKVTGALADALNWAGINEEQFNTQLQSLSTEQERVSLITETLNSQYKEAGDIFKENNASIISYRDAQVNLQNSLNDLGEAFQPILSLLTQFGADLLPKVTEKVKKLVEAFKTGGIEKFGKTLGLELGKTLTDLSKKLPKFVKFGVDFIKSLVKGIKDNVDIISESIIDVIFTLIDGIMELIPQIIELGAELIKNLIFGIMENLPILIENLQLLFEDVVTFFKENIGNFIKIGMELIFALQDGMLEMLPEIIMAALDIIVALAVGLIDALPKLIATAPKLIFALIAALTSPEMIAKIISAAIKLVFALVGALISMPFELAKSAITIVSDIFNNLKKAIFETNWIQLGKDIINGLLNGLKSMGSNIWDGVKGVGNNIVGGFKKFFGIASPSKLMKKTTGIFVGTGITTGMIEGVESELKNTESKIGNIITGMNFDSPQLDLNQDITSNSTEKDEYINNITYLDGDVIARSTNKINDRKNIQTMFA